MRDASRRQSHFTNSNTIPVPIFKIVLFPECENKCNFNRNHEVSDGHCDIRNNLRRGGWIQEIRADNVRFNYNRVAC